MIQKVIRVGNSLAVTIPKSFIDSYKVSSNGFVHVHEEGKKGRMILDFTSKKNKELVDEVIDPEVYKVAKQLLARYLPAFKELAKK